MPRVLIHVSINIRNALVEKFRQKLRDFNKLHGMNVKIVIPENNHEESWLSEGQPQSSFPDMALSHATDFVSLSRKKQKEVFMSLPERFPMREELREKGLLDPDDLLHTAFLVPFVIVCNARLVPPAERPVDWKGLMKAKWRNKVTFPHPKTPITQAVLAFLKNSYPKEFEEFYSSIKFQNSPVEVVKSVGDGLFPLGIANTTFAKTVEQRNVIRIWPAEGILCIPQVVVYKQGADQRLLELGDFLFDREVQEMIARQGFIPVNSEISLPQGILEKMRQFPWAGWEHYFAMLDRLRKVS